jgi:hypothetical protein
MMTNPRRLLAGVPIRTAAMALAGVAALGLGGCGTASTSTGAGTASVTGAATAPLELTDGWVKAVEDVGMTGTSTDDASSSSSPMGGMAMAGPMTAMFGTLKNATDGEVTVTGGSSAVAQRVELHETVMNADGQMQMQQKQDGFVIPAGGTFELRPGANHVMMIGLAQPLKNGTTVTVSLETSAGPVSFTVPVRTFTGANETYQASPSS